MSRMREYNGALLCRPYGTQPLWGLREPRVETRG